MKILAMLSLVLTACASRPPNAPRDELAALQQRIAVLKNSQLQIAADSDRCRKQGAVADEICHCADRICVLSEELAEEGARHVCIQAREDCQKARVTAGSCR